MNYTFLESTTKYTLNGKIIFLISITLLPQTEDFYSTYDKYIRYNLINIQC